MDDISAEVEDEKNVDNKLEKEKDKKKIWRSKVNKELISKYQKIFSLIDKLIFLKVPSFKLSSSFLDHLPV